MSYSAFTFNKVKKDFNLTVIENQDLFLNTPTVAPTDYLNIILAEHLPLVTAINTEKARSELVIMPVLIEVRRYLKYQVSIFLGQNLMLILIKG
ncbi:hypothetical protein [Nostoc sp. CMAA1605]|uniref:hypothetical protein n=1 Tax=Nostoc sp. CMAA1605 TaxID=2055159 RepID=UPI002E2F14D2|nr:hypothetical protein [Nostoc sp. CMAA1605]